MTIVLKPSKADKALASTEQLLIADGDARLELDPVSGLNKYGCGPVPDPELLAFGSSTASVISTEGFAVADRLRQQLLEAIVTQSRAAVYAREMQRIRLEWLSLCELNDIAGLELVFSPSGTDIHAVVAGYTGSGAFAPALIVMVDANETGSGVASALAGQAGIDSRAVEVAQIAVRLEDGKPRPAAAIDADVEGLVSKAVASDRRVLLILVDQSKTGLIAPSPGCVIDLHRRFPTNVEVLVDACQFRIAMPTLRAYLEQGFMVALTGSKFLGAPSFSAALLLPSMTAKRFRKRIFPGSSLSCSAKVNWPPDWTGAGQPDHAVNFGWLLRCEVALAELRRFRAVPLTATLDFMAVFAQAIGQRLLADPHFEALPAPLLDRRPLLEAKSWDHLQSIFPFLLYAPGPTGRIPLNREQTLHVYRQLPTPGLMSPLRCQLGQPVLCGTRHGIAVSALRLCLSSRLIIEAATHNDKGNAVIKNGLAALDKTALLIQQSKP